MDQAQIENMQNTIKSLQQRSQHIEKLIEKGNDVIIIQLGSDTIKYGLANQKHPNKIKNILAYKIKIDKEKSFHQDYQMPEDFEDFDAAYSQVEQNLRKKGNIKPEQKSVKGKPKAKSEQDMKRPYEKKYTQEDEPDVVFEDDVYFFEQRDDYAVKRPIQHGQFNLNRGKETIRSVTNDIERLMFYM